MIDSQCAQSALELAGGVLSIGGGGVAKEAESIGVKARWRPMFFKAGADNAKVAPSGVGLEASGQDAPRMVIRCEDERLFLRAGPPLVRRRIMLIKFSDGCALPASARLGVRWSLCDQGRIMLLDVIGDGGTRAVEPEAPLQLIRNEGVVERFGKGQNFLHKIGHRLGPELFVIAAGKAGLESPFVFEPLRAQP